MSRFAAGMYTFTHLIGSGMVLVRDSGYDDYKCVMPMKLVMNDETLLQAIQYFQILT